MAKQEPDRSITTAQRIRNSLNQKVEIKVKRLANYEVEEFVQHVADQKKIDPGARISLSEYVAQRFYPGQQGLVIVPDIGGLDFSLRTMPGISTTDYMIDLRGVDFSGCRLSGNFFQDCDLTGANFNDTDLDGSYFDNTKLRDVDFRGANLSHCGFDSDYETLTESQREEYFTGVKLNMTSNLAKIYAGMGGETSHETDYRQLEGSKIKELSAAYRNLSYWQKASVFAGQVSGNKEYDRLAAEVADMSKVRYNRNYFITPSLQRIFSSQSGVFDPCYVRGSSAEERNRPKHYITTNREDIEQYLNTLKDNPQLTLNDFMKQRFIDSGGKLLKNTMVHADLSSKLDLQNEWQRVDLSDLDFTGANLQNINFSGSNIARANFTNTNIGNSNFAETIVEGAKFSNTQARDANFAGADLSSIRVSNSNFTRAYMPRSNAVSAQILDSNFNFADIRNGRWDDVEIDGATFNYVGLEGASLANAVIKKTQMQHANLDLAIIKNCQLIESDLTSSYMAYVEAEKLKLENTILTGVDARSIDLTDAEIDELSTLSGADLEDAIMVRVKANKVDFTNANMSYVDASEASLKEAVLTGANMQFVDLEKAVLEGAEASSVDMTGANLTDVKARRIQFKNATLEVIKADRANFEGAVLEGANLRGAKLSEAILRKVDLKKADLRNAKMMRADLSDAQIESAIVNHGTELQGARISGVENSEITLESEDGRKETVTLEKKVKNDERLEAFKNRSLLGKALGKVANLFGNGLKRTGDFFTKPLSRRTGLICGIAIGVIIFAIAFPPLAGVGLGLVAAVAATAAIATVGSAAGYYIARSARFIEAVGVVAVSIVSIPTALVTAVTVAVGNKLSKIYFGKTISEFIASGFDKLSSGLKTVGQKLGYDQKAEELLIAQKKARAEYTPPQKKPGVHTRIDRREDMLYRDALARNPELVAEISAPPIKRMAPTLQQDEAKIHELLIKTRAISVKGAADSKNRRKLPQKTSKKKPKSPDLQIK